MRHYGQPGTPGSTVVSSGLVALRRVVVSGLPGSGKSTLGRQVAGRLNVAFLDKDHYLEALFDSEPPSSDRSNLSRRADEQFINDAVDADRAVLVSFWRRPELSPTAGTRTDWLENSSDVVELFCECSPTVAAQRFQTRRRHQRHDDAMRTDGVLLDQLIVLATLGPLGVGRLVRVDTERSVDIDEVIETLRAR
jgi:cytidylate kinase